MGVPDEEFADPDAVPEDLRCSLCFEVLQDPVEGSCGCEKPFCRPCLARAVEGPRRCPHCRVALRLEDMHVAHRTIRARLDALQRRCPRPGCSWTGLLEARHDHQCLPARMEQVLRENAELRNQVAKTQSELKEKSGLLEAEREQKRLRVSEKDAEITQLKGRVAELTGVSDEMEGVIRQLSNLQQRLQANTGTGASNSSTQRGAGTSSTATPIPRMPLPPRRRPEPLPLRLSQTGLVRRPVPMPSPPSSDDEPLAVEPLPRRHRRRLS